MAAENQQKVQSMKLNFFSAREQGSNKWLFEENLIISSASLTYLEKLKLQENYSVSLMFIFCPWCMSVNAET